MLDATMRDSWQTLADRLGSFIARRLPAQEVDDVRQDVLLRIHRNVGELEDDNRFGPWVYSIARNAVIDHLRKRGGQRGSLVDAPEPEAPSASEDELPLIDCVAPFVARLPTPYREAITLVELQGLTQSEAADMMGVSVSGMKSRVQRGRRMLRAMLEECCTLKIDARGRVFEAEPPGNSPCNDECK